MANSVDCFNEQLIVAMTRIKQYTDLKEFALTDQHTYFMWEYIGMNIITIFNIINRNVSTHLKSLTLWSNIFKLESGSLSHTESILLSTKVANI